MANSVRHSAGVLQSKAVSNETPTPEPDYVTGSEIPGPGCRNLAIRVTAVALIPGIASVGEIFSPSRSAVGKGLTLVVDGLRIYHALNLIQNFESTPFLTAILGIGISVAAGIANGLANLWLNRTEPPPGFGQPD